MTTPATPADPSATTGSEAAAADDDAQNEHPELAAGDAVPDQLTDEPTITPPVGAPGDPHGSGADA
jgi:hypothetical protein